MTNKVFALGNALVDYEFQVSDELLESLNLSKGSTQHIFSAQQQEETLQKLEQSDANFIKKASGGSGANTLFAIAALGGQSSFSCSVSKDKIGKFYLRGLKDTGIETSIESCSACDEPTGTCLVMITDDAERTMQTHLGISEHVTFSRVDTKLLKDAAYAYIEGYLASSEVSVEAVTQVKAFAKENNVKTALTFSDPAIVNRFRARLDVMLEGGVDVLFCNHEEALTYTHKEDLDEAILELHKYADLVAVTLGENGSCVSQKTANGVEKTYVEAFAAKRVIDTNGAGDSYAGAFLYGLTNGLTIAQSGKLAVQIAGNLVGYFGPRMPKKSYMNILERFMASENLS